MLNIYFKILETKKKTKKTLETEQNPKRKEGNNKGQNRIC